MRPIAGTASCEAPHFQYHVSGRLAIRMDDGAEFIAGPGDVTAGTYRVFYSGAVEAIRAFLDGQPIRLLGP